MKPLSLSAVAAAVNGRVLTGDPALQIANAAHDTRALKPGGVFFALKGERVDGHDLLDQAQKNGAVAAVIDREVKPLVGLALIQVESVRAAMGHLATHVRNSFDKTTVIAVAGSNGKTGTKHLIHAALSGAKRGTISPKSFNNDIGVPITLFPVDPSDDYVVLEIGTNHPGEVLHLAKMSRPDIAVITSIGEEHLEFFHDLDGVRRENASIIDGMNPDGLLIINGDDAGLLREVARHRGPIVRFGFGEGNDLRARNVNVSLDATRFDVAGLSFTVPMIGRHVASNALAAIAVARHLGVPDDVIAAGLANATGPEMRMQKRVLGDVTVINDAYNANPTSVRAALQTIADVDWPGRKVIVLGDMKELGETSASSHAEIATLATSLNFDLVFAVGDASRGLCDGASDSCWFADSSSAATVIAAQVEPGDLVLVKGSRSMRLEKIVDAIAERFAAPALTGPK